MKSKVCVFGSYNIDIAIKVPYMPIVGESLIGSESYIGPGGKGINQAIAASYAGASLYYIGKIGNDNFSTLAREYLHKIDIVGIKLFVSEEKPTGKALILVSNKENAENLIAVDPGANFTITQEEIETILPILSKCNILLVQLENNLDAVEYLISQSYKQGIKIILNPAPYQKISSEMISKVNIITPNEIEAELMTGIKITTIDDAYNASQILHKQGVENVIITLGNKGAYLSSTDGQFHIPPYPAIPVDTTGAGDAFNGALLAELSHGVKLIDACLFANAYASCAVEQKGTAFAMPVRKIVVEKMKTYSVLPIRF